MENGNGRFFTKSVPDFRSRPRFLSGQASWDFRIIVPVRLARQNAGASMFRKYGTRSGRLNIEQGDGIILVSIVGIRTGHSVLPRQSYRYDYPEIPTRLASQEPRSGPEIRDTFCTISALLVLASALRANFILSRVVSGGHNKVGNGKTLPSRGNT